MAFYDIWLQTLEKKLQEKHPYTEVLEKVEKLTGIKRQYIVIGAISLIALYLVIGHGAQLICNCIGFVYPAYASIVAIESRSKEDDTKWLTYWVVFAAFNTVEFFSDIILNWVPFYWLTKCIFLIWCFIPISNNGSSVIYNRFIRPVFIKNRETIDSTINKAMNAATGLAAHALDGAVKHVAENATKSD